MTNIVSEISEMFIKEASESPLLFNDLANMEKYVSESYSGRSLIELLQNADDAGARKFYIEKLEDNKFIVANDGRPFSDEDMLSLCRSGASTKRRKSNSIGYRGIGFKSVVNYAETVYLYSGSIKACFSKKLTQELLKSNNEVPLIRIPHVQMHVLYNEIVNKLFLSGYNTVFIFETKNKIWEQEITAFDSSCMIFLNTVCNINLICNNEYMYSSKRIPFREGYKVTLKIQDAEDEWYVIKSEVSSCKSSIAFKLDNDKVVKSNPQEAIAHCFMPTLNRLSIPMKINGDFSTDPSRNRITMDNETRDSVEACTHIVGNLVKNIINTKSDELGIVQILNQGRIDPLSKIKGEDINDLFCRLLKEYILDFLTLKACEKSIYLQPHGMGNDDFKAIIQYLNAYGVDSEQDTAITGLYDLLISYKIPYLPANLSVSAMRTLDCTDATKASVISALVKENKLGINNELKETIKESKLFKFDSEAKTINETNEELIMDNEFEGSVLENVSSPQEYISFIKKLGIKTSCLVNKGDNEHEFENTKDFKIVSTDFNKQNRVIKKWRTAEENVAEVLKLSKNVVDVKDVSKQNIGYDLEAIMQDGSKRFYEVKSVDGFSDTFSITNNEYTTANTNRNNYYLAIANISNDVMEVCFVKNPIDSLKFVKRITRWEWLCEDYSGETIRVTLK